MTIEQAKSEIFRLRSQMHSRSVQRQLTRWDDLLAELCSLEFTEDEQADLERELDLRINFISGSFSGSVLRSQLKQLLSFLKNRFGIWTHNLYISYAMLAGMIIALILNFNLIFGIVAGLSIGLFYKKQLIKDRRVISIDQFDLW